MTIKELLPDLESNRRIDLGNHIKDKPGITPTGYKTEDGYQVRTYSLSSLGFIVLEAAKIFKNG